MVPPLLELVNILDGFHVLDIGSGTGSLAIELVAHFPHCSVVGVDPSREYVAYANSRVSNPAVRFEVGNAQELSFSAGQFDACLSLLAFNFIPDARKALAEIRRVTRHGGRIGAAVWDYGGGMEMLRVFWDAAAAIEAGADRNHERHMPLCRAGDLGALWKETGLTDVEERPLEITTKFASFDDYWQPFLGGQGPAGVFVARLKSEHRTELREHIKRLLPKAAKSGAFELRARAWGVRGTVP